jgi:hypothetical protein
MKNSLLFCLITVSLAFPLMAQSNKTVWVSDNAGAFPGKSINTPEENQIIEVIYGSSAISRTNYADEAIGKVYDFDLPSLTLGGTDEFVLNFNLAYAYTPEKNDAMSVMISADAGQSWKTLYHNEGEDMSTTGTTSEYYLPSEGDWKSNQLSLSGFEGKVIIRFRFINGGGNNLYVDDINVTRATTMDGAMR